MTAPTEQHRPGTGPRRRVASTVAVVLVVALLLLHVWPPTPAQLGLSPRPFGAVPWDLAVHLVWMVAAWGAIIFIVAAVWRDPHIEAGDPEHPKGPQPPENRARARDAGASP